MDLSAVCRTVVRFHYSYYYGLIASQPLEVNEDAVKRLKKAFDEMKSFITRIITG